MSRLGSDRGTTLVELLVVLAILGAMAAVVGLTLGSAAPRMDADDRESRLAAARREALGSGRPVTVEWLSGDTLLTATAWPDGRIVAGSALPVDPLSGRRHAAK